jgi:hypothetical protein
VDAELLRADVAYPSPGIWEQMALI